MDGFIKTGECAGCGGEYYINKHGYIYTNDKKWCKQCFPHDVDISKRPKYWDKWKQNNV